MDAHVAALEGALDAALPDEQDRAALVDLLRRTLQHFEADSADV